jgi:hypothetical protein
MNKLHTSDPAEHSRERRNTWPGGVSMLGWEGHEAESIAVVVLQAAFLLILRYYASNFSCTSFDPIPKNGYPKNIVLYQ